MFISGQCLACGRLVNSENASKITKVGLQPVYCFKCEDSALAHLMTVRMDRAVELLRGVDLSGSIDQALQLLIRRLRGSYESLRALLKAGLFTEHHHDPATILRAMYDASLQVEFIVHDDSAGSILAQNYLDFQEIERHRLIKSLGKYEADFAGKPLTAEQREANMAEIKRRFEKVEEKFRKSKGPGYISSWHDEKLREFCKTRGHKEEYDFMLVLLHGAAHSSSLAMLRGYSISPSFLMLTAANLNWRAIGAMLEFHKIEPDPEIAGLIANARNNFLDAYKQTATPAPISNEPAATTG